MASGAGGRGGGGKIRTQRRDQGPVRASRPRRQQHPGILSRLPESIKNIVPGWLQRYFRESEDTHRPSVRTREVPHGQGNRGDHLTQATEASANISDGRETPEPTAYDMEDPSAASTASNGADESTGPSVHQSHLDFSLVESPAPPCQPSSSSAFPIDSCGFSLVKAIKDSASWHDAYSSTTSPFSSIPSEEDRADSKDTSFPTLWPPWAGCSHPLTQCTATSSRRQAFGLSDFGTLSSSLGNSSILKTNQLRESPSYPEKATYVGAAAAVRQSKLRRTPHQAPVVRQMGDKQPHAWSDGVTSSAARRILQSLEKMSSPLLDAKKIPFVVSSPPNSPLDRSGIHSTDFQAKRVEMDSQYPPVHRLLAPKKVPIATNQTVYFKPSVTPSREPRKTNQRIVDKDQQSTQHEKSVTPGQNRKQETGFPFPSTTLPAANGLSSGGGGGGGKIRQEETHCTAPKLPVEEEMEGPVLPKISPPTTSCTTAANTTSCKRKADEEYGGPFRHAKSLKEGSVLDVIKNPGSISSDVDSFAVQPTLTSQVDYTRPAIGSFTPSVIGLGESLKSRASWQCDLCLLPNKLTDERCMGCQAAKVPPTDVSKQTGIGTPNINGKPTVSASGTGFGHKFQPAVGTWDSDACLVSEKPKAIKYVACETPKPGTGVEQVLKLPLASEGAINMTAPSRTLTISGSITFGDKGSFRIDVSTDSGATKSMSGSF